ncbi:MAG: NAD(P)/FAD-dependent oxidoreductase [Propionibacterium sp.]|nr:NAD(P)/FAD-dependent oxidoreductase [Propionibacterium sp.]
MSGQRAVVVGGGPNGLTAAAMLARAGWDVEVHERLAVPGGAATSSDLLGEGTVVDPGAASFPFGVVSPAFRDLRLEEHGLEWAHAPYPMAHPLDDRPAAVLHRSLEETADGLGRDGAAWRRLHGHLVRDIDAHVDNLLGPVLRVPPHPLAMARFGATAALSADLLTRLAFRSPAARALFVGSAVHTIAPPTRPLTAAFGQLFGALGMSGGWPVARGGTGRIVDALVAVLTAHGGRIHAPSDVTDLQEFADADAVILNLTPSQVLRLRGLDVGPLVRRRLERWRYGPGVHKVDFLLSGPVPWADERVAGAGTVHVCGDVDDVRRAEAAVAAGRMPDRPFVMVCQQQAADPSRATGPAAGRQVLWTYAHVPHGYMQPKPGFVRDRIVAQIERFAPGFRDVVVDAVEHSPAQLEAWNPGLVGGDLAGGVMSGLQTVLRPGFTLRPHRLRRGLYLASGATPPGAGVHGMSGHWAARAAIRGSAG